MASNHHIIMFISNQKKQLHGLDGKLKLLRISIGIIYLWFGVLKFFENLSPAETLASETLTTLCFGLVSEPVSCKLLAFLETLIGLLLICNIFTSRIVLLALLHMCGTFIPLILQPDIIFSELPFGLSLVGQYILKNIVIICALFVLSSGHHRVGANCLTFRKS